MKILNKLLIAMLTLTIALSFSLSFNEVYAAKKASKVKTSAKKTSAKAKKASKAKASTKKTSANTKKTSKSKASTKKTNANTKKTSKAKANTKKSSTNTKKQNAEAEAKAKNDKKSAEIKKLIEDTKKKHPEFVAGNGMAFLNRSPAVSFEKGKNGKVNAKIEDISGIEKIIRTNAKTKNKKEIAGNKQKEQTDLFDEPAKNKEKTIVYTLKDIRGLTSKVTCSVTNKGSYDTFNISIRETFSYSNGYLNIILRDNGGINEGKASVEVIDKNTNKSLGKVTKKNIKIKTPIKYNGKNIYGIYQININKLTRDKDKNYFIQVNTTDNNGTSGYRMAKFSLSDAELAKLDAKKQQNNQTKTTQKKPKSTAITSKQTTTVKNGKGKISTSFDSYSFAEKGNTQNLNAKISTGSPLYYSSSNTNVVSVNKDGIVTARGPGSANITISAANNSSAKKVVSFTVPTVNTRKQALKPWFDAQKAQYKRMETGSRTFGWIAPTIANSKYKGTCLTFVACSLQRVNLLKSKQYISIKGGKLSSYSKKLLKNNNKLFEYKYVYKTRKQLGSSLKTGDILGLDNREHLQIYVGKNSKGQHVYNTSGHKTRLNSTLNGGSKFSVLIRIKTYNVKASCINGKISGNNMYMAKQNAKITYTPNNRKKLKSVTIDGKAIDIRKYPTSYTFKGITKNHTVKVVFE